MRFKGNKLEVGQKRLRKVVPPPPSKGENVGKAILSGKRVRNDDPLRLASVDSDGGQ